MQQVVSPLLSQESHVEFVPLQLFARVRHHLVEGALQQVFSPDEQPGGTSREQRTLMRHRMQVVHVCDRELL